MANVVFKWRITNCKYAYLTTTSGSDPFITEDRVDDSVISAVANNFSEEQYKTHYESMCTKIHADSDGKTMVMLDYKYYYNIDDTSCGLNAYGDAYTGSQGPAGRGIRSIQTIYGASATTLHFIFTDDTTYDAVIGNGLHGRNGLDGSDGEDGKNTNVVLELENKKEELENLRNEILSDVAYQLNNLKDKSGQDLDEFYKLYSGLTHDLASATTSINEALGLREYMNMYFHASSMTKTEFHEIWNPYSGFVETTGRHINGILSAVTNYSNKVDMANSQLSEAMSYYNQATGQLNSYWTKYDAINNRLENVVSELTGNSTVSLSEIYQTSREVGIMVTSTCGTTEDNPIMAAIVTKINDDNDSEIRISADKIYMLGETVASALTTVDLTINDGNSRFYSDGSGYIANRGIYWDRYGNMTITGQLSIGDVVEELGDTDVTFGKHTSSRTTFRSDGSGSLASGNIYWDADGNLTIKKDAKIEGTLSVDEIADGLGNKIMSFGKGNANATTYFYPDGSGSLAGGAISWDTDGSIKIAGDLTVGGSIIQEMIDKVDESNVNFGGQTSYFDKDGDGYLAGGLISWTINGGSAKMKIDGTVTIGATSSGDTIDAVIAALNTVDLAINSGKSYFNKDGSGWLANRAISWDSGGTLTITDKCVINGSLNATKGTIGSFSIDNNGLYSGEIDKWRDSTHKENLAYLTPSGLRLQQKLAYLNATLANLKVGLGFGADPSYTGNDYDCSSAGYFYRRMNFNDYTENNLYYPAVKIISENVSDRNIALYVQGAIIAKNSVLENSWFMDMNANFYPAINFEKGSTQIITNNNDYRYIFLPEYKEMRSIMGDSNFAVTVTIIAHPSNGKNFDLTWQGSASEYSNVWRDNNGNVWGGIRDGKRYIQMERGDVLRFVLIGSVNEYWGQLLQYNR